MPPLLLCALESETGNRLSHLPVIYTGIGKIQAAYALTRAITTNRPSRVINIGTAGSSVLPARTLVCCTSFVQRDMDVTPIGFAPYQTPFAPEEPVLTYGDAVPGYTTVCCGSGDHFDTTHNHDHPWQVVDMEAYALALICRRENIPFTCLKYISDGADGKAAATWQDALEDAALQLAQAVTPLMI